jgi:hypothetical protein
MTEQPVCFVGYSASDFVGSADDTYASYPVLSIPNNDTMPAHAKCCHATGGVLVWQ